MEQDLDLLHRTWRIESRTVDGRAVSNGYREARLVITGNRFKSLGMGGIYEGLIALDETLQPRHLDMRFDAGPEKGTSNLFIYEVRDDRLRLRIAKQGSTDPLISFLGRGAVEILRRTAP